MDGERKGDVRVSPSAFGVKARFAYDFDQKQLTVDVGVGGTLGIGSGVSLFGGVRATGDDIEEGEFIPSASTTHIIGSGSLLIVTEN